MPRKTKRKNSQQPIVVIVQQRPSEEMVMVAHVGLGAPLNHYGLPTVYSMVPKSSLRPPIAWNGKKAVRY